MSSKSGVEDVDPLNFSMKVPQILSAISSKLKAARSQLNPLQFEMLVAGRLDVREFMMHLEIERKSMKKPKGQFIAQKTEESVHSDAAGK